MNRLIIMITGMFSVSGLLLLDSAIKGTALLLLAAIAAVILRRDSAATRHLMWLLAIVALLIAPLLSAMLPQWRVLPAWIGVAPRPVLVVATPSSIPAPAEDLETPRNTSITNGDQQFASPPPAAVEFPDSRPAQMQSQITPKSQNTNWNWQTILPLLWSIGFGLLILRLLAARLMLWRFRQQSAVIGSTTDPLMSALQAACSQLAIRRRVTLLIHENKAIPVVWGIVRCHLLLPASARDWNAEQLRSALLHELAHVRRRDALAQLLTQIACALHWFNPLVWFAAWRLGAERERACDDLVLASGVRASAYAGHLLDVVTSLSTARWSQAGLAMARKSSLEGRLLAVLSKNQSRRRVSATLAVIALMICVGIAVPVAMLRAADQKPADKPAADSGKTPATAEQANEVKHLEAAKENKLQWGNAANGLRAALVIRNSSGQADKEKTPDLYMVVQNVSDVPIHFSDTVAAAPNVRFMTFQRDDVPQGRIKIDKPTQTDVTLKPREITYLLMIPRGDRPTRGQSLAAGMLKEPHMILFGEITIEKAPAGTWTGTLTTGNTGGAAALIEEPAAQKAPDANAASKLDPILEQSLKWGQPVNGLRAAVALRYATETPKASDLPELYIALQNVSDAAIRLTDNIAVEQTRLLYLKVKGDTKMGLGANDPKLGDRTLQPREVTLVAMFNDGKNGDGRTIGQLTAEGLLKDTHQSFVIHFNIDKAPAGSWTGKVVTGDSTGVIAAGQLQPKDKTGQELLALWQHQARLNGNFPGGLVARLGDKVNEFIRNNTGDAGGDSYAQKMKPIVPRLDSSHDWKPQDVVSLMDDIAAVTSIPLETSLREIVERTPKRGALLPKSLLNAPWGETDPSGLRVAWLFEPRAQQYEIGTALKSRILIHNAGKETAAFRTRTWNQAAHKATDINGRNLKVDSVEWTTLGRLVTYRLEPGEFIELVGAGIGVGAKKETDDWQNNRVGSWIIAKPGDDVTVTTAPVSLIDPWNEPKNGEPAWWLEQIKAHLSRELPLPTDIEERKNLVYRAGLEIFGTPLSAEEINTFVADQEPTALDFLAMRFAKRPGLTAFVGHLVSGPTQFHVIPVDPDAAKKPRAVNNPGYNTLSPTASLSITRRLGDDRIANEGKIQFLATDNKNIPQPYDLKLPDGFDTWAIAWLRGTNILFVQQKGMTRSIDFTNPAQVKETTLESQTIEASVPKAILDALRALLIESKPAALPATPPPAGRRSGL